MFDGLNNKKKRNIYAVIMLALLFFAAISANVIAAVILLIMFLLYALSMLAVLYMGERGVDVRVSMPEEMTQGETCGLELEVAADRWYYLANMSARMTIRNDLTGEGLEAVSTFTLLPPGRGRIRPLPVTDTHCGKLRVTVHPVEFTDLLDRVKRDSGETFERTICILPRLETVRDRALQSDDSTDVAPDGTADEELPGDGGFGTKNSRMIVLIPDHVSPAARQLTPDQRSRLFQRYLSASRTLLSAGHAHSLLWYDAEQGIWRLEPVRDDESFEHVMREVLGTAFTEPAESLPDGLHRLTAEEKDMILIFMTACNDADIPDANILESIGEVRVIHVG